MSKREVVILLNDILESIGNIEDYVKGFDKKKFLKSKKTKDAVIRNLEIIGEATKNISAGFRNAHKNIDWRGMAGLRDVVIHSYFNVDAEVVWEIIKKDVNF